MPNSASAVDVDTSLILPGVRHDMARPKTPVNTTTKTTNSAATTTATTGTTTAGAGGGNAGAASEGIHMYDDQVDSGTVSKAQQAVAFALQQQQRQEQQAITQQPDQGDPLDPAVLTKNKGSTRKGDPADEQRRGDRNVIATAGVHHDSGDGGGVGGVTATATAGTSMTGSQTVNGQTVNSQTVNTGSQTTVNMDDTTDMTTTTTTTTASDDIDNTVTGGTHQALAALQLINASRDHVQAGAGAVDGSGSNTGGHSGRQERPAHKGMYEALNAETAADAGMAQQQQGGEQKQGGEQEDPHGEKTAGGEGSVPDAIHATGVLPETSVGGDAAGVGGGAAGDSEITTAATTTPQYATLADLDAELDSRAAEEQQPQPQQQPLPTDTTATTADATTEAAVVQSTPTGTEQDGGGSAVGGTGTSETQGGGVGAVEGAGGA